MPTRLPDAPIMQTCWTSCTVKISIKYPCFFSHFLTLCKVCSRHYGFPQDNCTTECSFHDKYSSFYCYVPFTPPRVFSYQASLFRLDPSIRPLTLFHFFLTTLDPYQIRSRRLIHDPGSRRLNSTTPFSLSRLHSEFLVTSHFLTYDVFHVFVTCFHSFSLMWQDDQGHRAAGEHGTLSQW